MTLDDALKARAAATQSRRATEFTWAPAETPLGAFLSDLYCGAGYSYRDFAYATQDVSWPEVEAAVYAQVERAKASPTDAANFALEIASYWDETSGYRS